MTDFSDVDFSFLFISLYVFYFFVFFRILSYILAILFILNFLS